SNPAAVKAKLQQQITEARAQLAESTARLVAAKLREAKIEDLVTDTLRRVYHLPADCVPGGEQRERLLAVAEVCVAYDLRVGAEGRALDTFKAFLAALPAR